MQENVWTGHCACCEALSAHLQSSGALPECPRLGSRLGLQEPALSHPASTQGNPAMPEFVALTYQIRETGNWRCSAWHLRLSRPPLKS